MGSRDEIAASAPGTDRLHTGSSAVGTRDSVFGTSITRDATISPKRVGDDDPPPAIDLPTGVAPLEDSDRYGELGEPGPEIGEGLTVAVTAVGERHVEDHVEDRGQ
jgi:hypothetical protein